MSAAPTIVKLETARRAECLLCGRLLVPIGPNRQRHPASVDCQIKLTDNWGVVTSNVQDEIEKPEEQPFIIEGFTGYPSVDLVLEGIFKTMKIARLGGKSSGRGWSSISLYQRCPYAFKRRHVDRAPEQAITGTEPEGRAVGTLVHTFLALYYTQMIDPAYPLSPELCHTLLLSVANPKYINEGWRVFTAYRLWYKFEKIRPLAIEYDLRDPRNNESCRFDLIAFFDEDEPGSYKRRDGMHPGTYQLEHKTSGRFDDATLNGWANDGEVIGQMMLWERLGLDHRFGPIKGGIVNILGKQKEPLFHRTLVAPATWQTDQHASDLRNWEAMIQSSRAANHWPRARGNCIGRFGKCDHYDHCSSTEQR